MIFDNQKYSIILPARIVEYFVETQTATIQICAETVFNNANEMYQSKERQPIEDVPVHTPSGGGWSFTMPIKEGDTCVIIFSQVGYDHWLYEDKDKAGKLAGLPKSWLHRQFNDDDGFAFVGLNTLPRAIKDYSETDSQWRNEDATQVISLKEDLSIDITSPLGITINAPTVTVNCTSSVVNTETAEISASSNCDINTPTTNVSGILNVGGLLVAAAGMTVAPAAGGGPAATMSGDISMASANIVGTGSDITLDGISLKGHTHNDAESRPTSTPT